MGDRGDCRRSTGRGNHRALILNAPRPRGVEGIVEVAQAFLHEDITKRIAEQIVDEFVPHTQGHGRSRAGPPTGAGAAMHNGADGRRSHATCCRAAHR